MILAGLRAAVEGHARTTFRNKRPGLMVLWLGFEDRGAYVGLRVCMRCACGPAMRMHFEQSHWTCSPG